MTVGQIFTKIGNFIENRQIFMLFIIEQSLLILKIFKHTCRGPFFRGHSALHHVSKNVPPLACYNFDAHE